MANKITQKATQKRLFLAFKFSEN